MTQQTDIRIQTVPHEVNRLTVGVSAPFQEFRERDERAIPPFDTQRFEQLIKNDADWDTILRATAQNAPHDFIIYRSHDFSSLTRLAGERWICAVAGGVGVR
jgi:hypothetical protein